MVGISKMHQCTMELYLERLPAISVSAGLRSNLEIQCV